MKQPRIVIPGDAPVMIGDSPNLDRLREVASVELHRDRPRDEAEQVARVQGAEILLNSRGLIHWPGHLLEQLPSLKLIALCSIGTDCIDLNRAKELGITVCNVPGRTASVVAEHAFCLMLSLSRRIARMTELMRRGEWPHEIAVSLEGKTLGIVGTGQIGCEMIRRARAFGMKVVAWSFHPDQEKARTLDFEYADLNTVLSVSDAVSVHVKLTDDSRGLIGQTELGLMKPGCLFINTARGAIVREDALVDSLNSGHLGGAALDVFVEEPLPADHPLLKCEQVVLTPHSADQVPEGIDGLTDGCVQNILNYLNGSPTNVVT
ncbi:MAG: NAD(P)-dependent oxidoreductase [Planctomycetaceae bacterium]